ncbi:hypothetical protein GGX14DRAFT_406400 [Mycena pura]|uniref:Uncharacterized protein n=1 Tax=Mycena pura TaxID=153505 RepID=A0AAD6XZR2_9AGAR|nr:hypothetical protein GGX14DRAFT_406400 [Mycena pura]
MHPASGVLEAASRSSHSPQIPCPVSVIPPPLRLHPHFFQKLDWDDGSNTSAAATWHAKLFSPKPIVNFVVYVLGPKRVWCGCSRSPLWYTGKSTTPSCRILYPFCRIISQLSNKDFGPGGSQNATSGRCPKPEDRLQRRRRAAGREPTWADTNETCIYAGLQGRSVATLGRPRLRAQALVHRSSVNQAVMRRNLPRRNKTRSRPTSRSRVPTCDLEVRNAGDTEIARIRALIAGQQAPEPAKRGRGRPKGSVKKATPEVEIVPKATKKLTKKAS